MSKSKMLEMAFYQLKNAIAVQVLEDYTIIHTEPPKFYKNVDITNGEGISLFWSEKNGIGISFDKSEVRKRNVASLAIPESTTATTEDVILDLITKITNELFTEKQTNETKDELKETRKFKQFEPIMVSVYEDIWAKRFFIAELPKKEGFRYITVSSLENPLPNPEQWYYARPLSDFKIIEPIITQKDNCIISTWYL